MNPSDEQKGTSVPPAGEVSCPGNVHAGAPDRAESREPAVQPADPQDSSEDGYRHEPEPPPPAPSPPRAPAPVQAIATLPRRQGGGGKTPPPPPPPSGGDGDDEDDEGMLRMSFLGHLEELRTRI